MNKESYKPDGNTLLRHKQLYRWVGHSAATCAQYSVYVAEGVWKNTYNGLKNIPDWRTEDPEGDKERLPALAEGWQQFYIRNLYGNIEDTFNRPIESSPDGWIDVSVREREASSGYFSQFKNTGEARHCLNLGSYNYLGFGGVNSYCTPVVEDAVRSLPISTCSSSAELGHSQIHVELEEMVAAYVGKPSAFVVGMGFATNSLVLPAIVGKGDLILSDEQNHRSIAEGARVSGAKIKAFRHNDHSHLEELLQDAVELAAKGKGYGSILVVVEGIYSMEGELCELPEIVEVSKRYGAMVYLDEAHSIGAVGPTGRGVCEELGVDTAKVDIMMGTFTKSFGASGGYVSSSPEIVHRIRSHCAGCLDSVSMPPACAAQIMQALKVISGQDGTDVGSRKLKQLRDNSQFFRDGLKALGLEVLGHHPSPIMPVMLYQPYKIGDFSRLALEKNLAVVVVGSPAVPLFLPRVRFCISAAHTREDLVMALKAIDEVADVLSIKFQNNPPPAWLPADTISALMEKRKVQAKSSADSAALRRSSVLKLLEESQKKAMKTASSTGAKAASTLPAHTLAVSECESWVRAWDPEGVRPESCEVQVSSQDYLGLKGHPGLAEACLATVRRVGCGSCSPRGFYGTFPEHVQLEKNIAKFLGVGEAVLYSFGACTVSSVIPALLKAGDVAVVDEGVGHGVLIGLRLSKAKVVFYSHCDAVAAGRALEQLEAEDGDTSFKLLRPRKERRRRFLISEGVFQATGQVAPLAALVALRSKHKARLILEESHSFGVLGATGRGLTEHANVPASKVDVITASLEGAGASVGGFAAGAVGVVSYQRLMGAGYVFSAALPPFLATASVKAIQILEEEAGPRLQALRESAAYMRAAFRGDDKVAHASEGRVFGLTTPAAPACSPVVPIYLSSPSGDVLRDTATLAKIANLAQQRGVGICLAQFSHLTGLPRRFTPPPSLRVYASAGLTKQKVEWFINVLVDAAGEVLGSSPHRAPQRSLFPAIEDTSDGAASPVSLGSKDVLLVDSSASASSSSSSLTQRRNRQTPTMSAEVAPDAAASTSNSMSPFKMIRTSVEMTAALIVPELPNTNSAIHSDQEAMGASSVGAVQGEDEFAMGPVSMTVPLLTLVMAIHALARRYIVGQVSSTERFAPTLLQTLNVAPSSEESIFMSVFFAVVNFLASRKFYICAGPVLMWLCECSYMELLVVCYCLNCVVGCGLKATLLTNTNACSNQPATSHPKRMHAWPSVAAVNATALPFVLLRLHFGTSYVWEMDQPLLCMASYSAALMWVVLVSIARMRAGDSPADVQGGVVVGAIIPRVLLPLADPLHLWLRSGEQEGVSLMPLASLALGSLLIMALFPMPLNKHGKVFPDAIACLHRVSVILAFLVSFLAGCLLLHTTSPASTISATSFASSSPTLLACVLRSSMGLALTALVSHLLTVPIQAALQKALQTLVGGGSTPKLVPRGLRRACTKFVLLSRAAAFGFSVSYIVPVAFGLVGV